MAGAAEFIRARTRWNLPRTHGPMLPEAAAQTANGALSRVEQTKRFAILPVSWEPGRGTRYSCFTTLRSRFSVLRIENENRPAASISASLAGKLVLRFCTRRSYALT